jgi:hypothetical protein
MLKGWRDLAVEVHNLLNGLLWRAALVTGVAVATYAMLTRGYTR